jgi:hypothetical protein
MTHRHRKPQPSCRSPSRAPARSQYSGASAGADRARLCGRKRAGGRAVSDGVGGVTAGFCTPCVFLLRSHCRGMVPPMPPTAPPPDDPRSPATRQDQAILTAAASYARARAEGRSRIGAWPVSR